jgi:citrate lyase subunit beta/citryl-CoA lyase
MTPREGGVFRPTQEYSQFMVNSDLRSPQSRLIRTRLRSCLIVDAQSREGCLAALGSGADALFIMLGDAQDEATRRRAREATRDMLKARSAASPAVYIQAAPLESEALERDLVEIMPSAPDGVLLEDAQTGANVQHLSAKLAVAEALAGLEERRTDILALVQSPAGVLSLSGFAGASARLAALVFDEDALRERLSCTGASPLSVARSLIALGAAAAGVAAISRLPRDAGDENAVAKRCRDLHLEGFTGIAAACSQFEAVRRAFGEDSETLGG